MTTATTSTSSIPDPAPTGALLTPSEVAALFRVDPKTVTRWAKAGRLDCIRTLGGHRRYPAEQFPALLTGGPTGAGVEAGSEAAVPR